MAAFSMAPASKKVKLESMHQPQEISEDTCVICSGGFCDDDKAVSPDITRLESLFQACRDRQDIPSQRLLQA